MKHPVFAKCLSIFLVLSLLVTGCTSASTPSEEDIKEAAEVSFKEEAITAVEEAAAQPTEESAPEEASSEEESVPEEENTEEETGEAQAFAPVEFDVAGYPVGDIVTATPLEDGEEASQEEIDRIDRAMRDYQYPETSLLINNAKTFYYYECLNEAGQELYDTLLMAASDPSGSNYVVYLTYDNPTSTDFKNSVNLCFWCMLYDHPELYYLYITRNIRWKYGRKDASSPYTIYFYVDAYPTFEQDMTAFNQAVAAFLKDIDTTKAEMTIATQIHDKLISMVDYDYDLYYNKNLRYDDLGHTAFGALVHNQDNVPNCAVCDGYSLAYIYLMQQVGLNAVFVSGMAGSSEQDLGGHAWNIAYISGRWYEIDCTWDDFGNKLVNPKLKATEWYPYYVEMSQDQTFVNIYQHSLFLITTAEMRNYKSSEYQYYYTKDKKWIFDAVGNSVHIRDNEYGRWYIWDAIMGACPIAK